ncbi:MAG: hypothetical protein FWD96_00165 [Defluviitaleaceae bacterium]|nr:hypothetical protein [Defluviitaleaceae bacterium]
MTLTGITRALMRYLFSKNVLIIFLMISAAYLTGLLWFERISSNRNFFYTLMEAVTPTPILPEGFEQPFVEPMRIVTGFGNRSYIVDYLTDGNPAHTAHSVLRQAVSNAAYTHTIDLDWPALLLPASYVLDYPVRIPREMISGAWGTRDSAITRQVAGFCAIIISPGITSADGITITFTDSAYGLAHLFRLENDALRIALRAEITAAQDQEAEILFSASSEVAAHMFHGNVFIPIFGGDSLTYNLLRAVSPYAGQDGRVQAGSILPRISSLFAAPAAITVNTNDNEFIFSDEHTVVRFSRGFSHGSILEYSNHRSFRHPRALTLGEAYGVARAFIQADALLPGRTYLESFSEEDGAFIFSFGVAAYGFPVIMPTHLRHQHGMHSPVEVTVRGGIVANYRKWGQAFERAHMRETATIGFFGVYDNILDSRTHPGVLTTGTPPYVNSVALAFYPHHHSLNNTLSLMWDLRLDGIRYIEPTGRVR